MSVKHLALVADITGLNPTCKLVLYALAIESGGDGWSCLTYYSLNRLTGLSERAVRTNLRTLEVHGIVAPHPEDPSRRRLVAVAMEDRP